MATLKLGRGVIEANHRADQDKPESEKFELLTSEEWIRSVSETQTLESQMRASDIQWIGNLMFKQGRQDHNVFSRLGVTKNEHR